MTHKAPTRDAGDHCRKGVVSAFAVVAHRTDSGIANRPTHSLSEPGRWPFSATTGAKPVLAHLGPESVRNVPKPKHVHQLFS